MIKHYSDVDIHVYFFRDRLDVRKCNYQNCNWHNVKYYLGPHAKCVNYIPRIPLISYVCKNKTQKESCSNYWPQNYVDVDYSYKLFHAYRFFVFLSLVSIDSWNQLVTKVPVSDSQVPMSQRKANGNYTTRKCDTNPVCSVGSNVGKLASLLLEFIVWKCPQTGCYVKS